MRMNFFFFLFLVFLIVPFAIISCTRSLTSLIRPSPNLTNPTSPTSPTAGLTVSPTGQSQALLSPTVSPKTSPSTSPSTSPTGDGRCSEGCCICGDKPVGHLFVLHDRSYRLCRRHLSEVPKLIDSALKRIPNTFFTLSLYDYDTIVAVAKTVK